ncbi:hypothetical protein EHO59_05940 [Leptospira semungkisensis]|uniref:Uncharacterized protein n=1 Tax=Leptospira semungkisensis TaxID=2484985 RepID=A0A4R9G9R2_9LEPT|nr:hypothetical protein [Leptospira semungkisensis]TGK07637.1 hypothetical protein EHO59_05940 [Leptospira semungkisensis]
MELEQGKMDRLSRGIELGKKIVLHGVVLSEFYKSNLENYLRFCLEFYKKTDILPPGLCLLYSLLERTYRENCRNSYYKEKGWDPSDPESLTEREAEFEKDWDFSDPLGLKPKLKQEGFFLRTTILHGPSGITVELANKAVITSESEEELTEYLSRAKSYSNLSEYYEDYPFDEEGREIDIALSFLQFQEIGLNPNLLRFDTMEGEHVFRVEIPFDSGHQSLREKIENGEDLRPFRFHSDKEKEGETIEPWKLSVCTICGRTVDDRIFFRTLPEDVIDRAKEIPSTQDVCAWCLSGYLWS